jgi:hypothetical protein
VKKTFLDAVAVKFKKLNLYGTSICEAVTAGKDGAEAGVACVEHCECAPLCAIADSFFRIQELEAILMMSSLIIDVLASGEFVGLNDEQKKEMSRMAKDCSRKIKEVVL